VAQIRQIGNLAGWDLETLEADRLQKIKAGDIKTGRKKADSLESALLQE